MPQNTLIHLDQVTLRIYDRTILEDTSWRIDTGEHWAIIGPNGAGKTTLLRSLLGEIPVISGHIQRGNGTKPTIQYVGPELHRRYLRDDARKEILWSPVSNAYPAVTAETILEKRKADPVLADFFLSGLNVADLRRRPIRTLSTGEMRKVLLAAAAASRPDILILDEPFDGLDAASVEWFAESLHRLDTLGVTLILATHRGSELIDPFDRVLIIDSGMVAGSCDIDEARDRLVSAPEIPEKTATTALKPTGQPVSQDPDPEAEVLVDFSDVTVRYQGTPVVEQLSWTIRSGEHWCLAGPNGSGKTTLLDMMCGDNLQAYANTIELFGRRKGTGESIWEIKEKIGYITPGLSARYDKPISVLEVILSGFFDSIGLYRWPAPWQEEAAKGIADKLGLGHLLQSSIDAISAGERMAALIARAIVKKPVMLILDEPCQGLDPAHRQTVLSTVDSIARSGETTIVYVTHRSDEMPGCINRVLTLGERKARHSFRG